MPTDPPFPSANDVITFRANGKVLLSGEYAVLDGALALALPTRPGQTMNVRPGNEPGRLSWRALDAEGNTWFQALISFPDAGIVTSSSREQSLYLIRIFEAAGMSDWDPERGYAITTRLEFSRQWGLGSSSTLISLLAQWTGADPYALLDASFGGSGYDLACATAPGPVLYQRREGTPHAVEVPFRPSFAEQLYFVGLNAKQDTRAGIERYRERAGADPSLIDEISACTMEFLRSQSLDGFEKAMRAHEDLIAGVVDLPKAKDLIFPDYWGEAKSLGAWGGDLVLLTSDRDPEATKAYFKTKGYSTFFHYKDLILNP